MAAYRTKQSDPHNRFPQRLEFDDQDLWQTVVEAPAVIVFLDFDGTLVEIAPTPTDVLLSEPRKRWLKDFLSCPQCSIGVVSGRPVDELKRLIGLEQIFYVGCHGLEWAAPDGNFHMSWPDRVVVDALSSLRDEMCRVMAHSDGIILEDKGVALALHYRRAERDTALAAREEFVRAVHRYQQQGIKLELLVGKEVIEAKPTGTTKGDAITQILARYVSTALPIYIGDDLTDETAFDAIAEIGIAILVAEMPRETAAARILKNPTEVYVFLRCLTRMMEMRERT